MLSPENYNQVPYKLFKKNFLIGGMAGPHNSESQTSVILYLKEEEKYDVIIGLHDIYNFTEEFNDVGIDYHYLPMEDFSEKPIPVKTLDSIYRIVEASIKDNKKIGIHCGEGHGRTGIALASIKIHELIELESRKKNKSINLILNGNSKIMVEGIYFPCTSFTKKAIEIIRSKAVTSEEDNSSLFIETKNDVKTLMIYEKHLINQLKSENEKVNNLHALSKFLSKPQIDKKGKCKNQPDLSKEEICYTVSKKTKL